MRQIEQRLVNKVETVDGKRFSNNAKYSSFILRVFFLLNSHLSSIVFFYGEALWFCFCLKNSSKFSPTFNLRLNRLYTFISYLLRGEVLDEKHELDLQTPHSIIFCKAECCRYLVFAVLKQVFHPAFWVFYFHRTHWINKNKQVCKASRVLYYLSASLTASLTFI